MIFQDHEVACKERFHFFFIADDKEVFYFIVAHCFKFLDEVCLVFFLQSFHHPISYPCHAFAEFLCEFVGSVDEFHECAVKLFYDYF